MFSFLFDDDSCVNAENLFQVRIISSGQSGSIEKTISEWLSSQSPNQRQLKRDKANTQGVAALKRNIAEHGKIGPNDKYLRARLERAHEPRAATTKQTRAVGEGEAEAARQRQSGRGGEGVRTGIAVSGARRRGQGVAAQAGRRLDGNGI